MLANSARELASRLIRSQLPRRWAHVVGVADKATRVAAQLDDVDTELVVAAAWLHDIGYSTELVESGLHALDGARYLRDHGWDPRVVALVAHHSASRVEAAERGLERDLLREFAEPADRSSLEVLVYCDMTTGPAGEVLSVEQRLAEISKRYGPKAVVTKFVDEASDDLVAIVHRVEERLRQ